MSDLSPESEPKRTSANTFDRRKKWEEVKCIPARLVRTLN